ncbi:unnamed protein product [Caenorhabditis brenneri]
MAAGLYEKEKNGWDKETPEEVEKNMKKYESLPPDVKKVAKMMYEPICEEFFKSEEYKKGDKKYPGYKYCCEMIDNCSFYKQTWFYLACGGAALLLIIIGIVISVCLCCKKRGGGGKDVEATEETTEEEDSKIH